MVVCDEAVASEIEADVHTLENARLRLWTESYPLLRWLSVYLILSHPRTGTYEGEVWLMRDGAGARTASNSFRVAFDSGTDHTALYVELGECRFPASGDYTARVYFFDEDSHAIQKGEAKLEVHTMEAES